MSITYFLLGVEFSLPPFHIFDCVCVIEFFKENEVNEKCTPLVLCTALVIVTRP